MNVKKDLSALTKAGIRVTHHSITGECRKDMAHPMMVLLCIQMRF